MGFGSVAADFGLVYSIFFPTKMGKILFLTNIRTIFDTIFFIPLVSYTTFRMKLLYSLFSVLFFGFWQNLACAQVSKTIHQTFTVDGAQIVNINVVGSKVEMRETKGTRVLVETTVRLSVPNDRLLDFVVTSGRYDLIKTFIESSGEVVLESKKDNNVIMVKGEECHEEISYIFYIPTAIKFANNSTIEKVAGGE